MHYQVGWFVRLIVQRETLWFVVLALLIPLIAYSEEEFWQRNLIVHRVTPNNSNVIAAEVVKVNLNTADFKTLQTLYGIGPKKAQAIIDYRKTHGVFKSINDLSYIKGFNKSMLSKLIKNSGEMIVFN